MLTAIGGIIFFVGLLVSFVFGVQLLILNFQENVLWGLASLFFSIPMWFFIAMRWDKAGGPFLKSLGGTAMAIFGGMVMSMGG